MVPKNLWEYVYKYGFTWVTRLSILWALVSYLWTRGRSRKQSIENGGEGITAPFQQLSGDFLVDAVAHFIMLLADSLTWGIEFM
jgi:hypothetical protein